MSRPLHFVKYRVKKIEAKNESIMAMGVYSDNLQEAEKIARKILSYRNGLTDFNILRISDEPIKLKRFIVFVSVIYRGNFRKDIEISIIEENQKLAEQQAIRTIKSWKKVKDFQVFGLREIETNNY